MQHDIEYNEVDLLKDPPTGEDLQHLADLVKVEIRDLLNPRSQAFKKLQPDMENMNARQAAALVKDNPRILTRPLLTDGITLLLGFNEKKYQQFFSL